MQKYPFMDKTTGCDAMQCTGFYRILDHSQNDIEDFSDSFIVNCTGKMYKEEAFESNLSRKDFYLLYVVKGELLAFLEEGPTEIKEGSCLFFFPNRHFHFKFDGVGINSYYWVHFTGNQAESTLNRFKIKHESLLNIGVHTKLINLFEKIASEMICREEDFPFYASTYLLQLLVEIKRFSEVPEKSNTPKKLKKSIEVLHTNYHKPLSINDLAQIEELSPGRYRTLFHNMTGVSPKQYLTDIRMRHACELLCQTKLTAEQIGKMVGYDDSLYFYRIFKKQNNITPTQYRINYSETSNKPDD